ncbi:MAG: thioredoxin domain-containing protein [Chloroflexi bacterium]|nr:thioredoxin domain-containing protein [Chloroflexota bacterium]
MSNRQARREQSRTTQKSRQQRPPVRTSSRGPGGKPPSGGGSPDWLSRPFLLGLAAVIIVLGVIAAIVMTSGGNDSSTVKQIEAMNENLPVELAKGTALGKDDAPLKLTEYEDFQCPFCLKYTASQEGVLIEEYVKTGKLQIIYNHLPLLGVESANAALASQCAADQDKFWQYHDELFLIQAKAGQIENEKKNVGRFSDAKLKDLASQLGLDRTKFDTCYDGKEHLDLVNNQQRTASSFGITGTPGFLINGSPLGSGAPATVDDWRKVLDQLYTQVTASPTAAASTTPAAAATPKPTTSPAAATTPAATATKAP